MDPVWQVITGFAVLLTLSVFLLLCCCCCKDNKVKDAGAAKDKDAEAQDNNNKLNSSTLWKPDIPPPAPSPSPPIPPSPPPLNQSRTSLRSASSIRFIVRPKSSPKSDIFKAKNRILSKCPRNYRILEENYRQPAYKGRDRHLYSGPGELTKDIATNISERRSWQSVYENTVLQEPPQWNLCERIDWNYDNKRIISSSKVLTIHCKRFSHNGPWSASVKGHCFAIFTDADSGHLFYKETYATVNEF